MAQRILNAHNIDKVLREIKQSCDSLYDFSGTNFKELNREIISDIFICLNSLPQPFLLRLNYCKFDEIMEDGCQIKLLANGLRTAHNMHGFEFIRSLSTDCPESVLREIAYGLLANHQIKSITLDGFRVTPPIVHAILRKHPTVLSLVIDGLLKQSQLQLFKLSNKPSSNTASFEPIKQAKNKLNNR